MAGERSQALLHITRTRQLTLVAGPVSTNLGTADRLGAVTFDATGYPDTATFTLKVLAQVDSAQTYNIRLYDVTAGAYLTGTISDTNGSLELKELALTLGTGERIYELHGWLTTGSGGSDYLAVPGAHIEVVP